MATDYAEKERAFIESLAGDTGADLHGWMKAIQTSGLSERNEIIDWLRQQGFAFAKASWIERINHNGGRLIYGDDASAALAPVRAQVLAPMMPFAGKPPERQMAALPAAAPSSADVPASPAARTSAALAVPADVSARLAAAKGLRPLADVLIAAIAAQVPGMTVTAQGEILTFAAPKPFAALLPGPKELRLYGDFGALAGPLVKRADAAGRALVPFPHVIALNDVRQIDEALQTLIQAAHARAHN